MLIDNFPNFSIFFKFHFNYAALRVSGYKFISAALR